MALTGTEAIQVVGVQSNGQPSGVFETVTTAQIASAGIGVTSTTTVVAVNTVGAATLTAAQMFQKIIQRGGVQSAVFTDTTDTAANIIATMGAGVAIGASYQFTYYNASNFTSTLAGGTGVTISNATAVPPGGYTHYILTYTAAATITMVAFEGGFVAPTVQGATYNINSGNTPLSLAAANIGGSTDVNLNLSAVLAGAGTATLPTVAALAAVFANPIAGFGYNLRIINTSTGAFAWTVATNTGWTLNGTMTIAQNTFRDFVVTFQSLTTATLQQVGTGTTS